eukprot:c2408_g1_i1 orf=45-215(-)
MVGRVDSSKLKHIAILVDANLICASKVPNLASQLKMKDVKLKVHIHCQKKFTFKYS